jgi:hypothetical protein
MSDPGWNDYLGSTTDSDASEAETPATDEAGAAAADADVTDDLGDASTAADWATWNDATADEQSADAQRYVDAADVSAREGFDDAAAQDLTDAGMEEGLAADHSATAADYTASAESDLTDASADTAAADDSTE